MRGLEEDARAVARVLLGTDGTAVLEVHEHLESLREDVVRGAPLMSAQPKPQASCSC